jgi:hypothetical protein
VASGVSLGRPLSGSARIEPALVIENVTTQDLGGSMEVQRACVGWIDSAELERVVFAPLAKPTGSAYVAVRSRGGYQPEPPALESEELARSLCAGEPFVPPAVVLSGRRRWVWSPTAPPLGELRVFDSAALLAGHREVGAYSKAWRDCSYRTMVPFVLFPFLLLEEEAACFQRLSSTEPDRVTLDRSARPSSMPTPLKVGTTWISVEIVSEPFVVRTGRGYAPLLLVEELESGERRGLYAGARSLANELEGIRDMVGRLTGTRIRVRKRGEEKTARYEVRVA